MADEFKEYLSIANQSLLFCEILKIQPIPETTKPVSPIFTAGKFNKKDVTNLLGTVNIPHSKPEKRKLKAMKEESVQMEFSENDFEQSIEKLRLKQRLSLSPSVTKVGEYSVQGVFNLNYVLVDKLGRLWVSDNFGHIVQTYLQGNLIKSTRTIGKSKYTVTQDEDLIITDTYKNVIYKITPDEKSSEFLKTEDWTPFSLHSSRINGDILVAMRKRPRAKITRYNKKGEEIQHIQRDNQGQELYGYPHYITENKNGDICTSDYNKEAVVVVNNLGQYRFSHIGYGSEFRPCGICTDVLSHILVCDSISNSIHLLDQDGGFLSVINSPEVSWPRDVCVDDENNLYVGQFLTNTVAVFKYLQ